MPSAVRINAPSRIHFGLLALDKDEGRRFGGVGVMVEQPCTTMTMRVAASADEGTVSGPHAVRVRAFIESWRDYTGLEIEVACDVHEAPPEHVGLGLGTQLGLAVALGLDSLSDRAGISLEERARSVGRGNRSAVGTHGFGLGGLIVDAGKPDSQSLGELHERIALPVEWCVVLVRIKDAAGLAGDEESAAFAGLPPVSSELKLRLRRELFDRLIPAAHEGDFESFCESVYQYGHSAGECFASPQGGPFLTAKLAEFISFCRDICVPGVGQSSWGPTVFCWFRNRQAADRFVTTRLAELPNFEADVIVTQVAQAGAACVFEEIEE